MLSSQSVNVFDHRHAIQRDRLAIVTVVEPALTDVDIRLVSIERAEWQTMNGCVGLDIWPLIRGLENDGCTMDVALLWRGGGGAMQNQTDVAPTWMRRVIGSWVCVAGTAVGAANGPAIATDRYCKTMTPGITGEGVKLQTKTGASIVTFPSGTVAAAYGMVSIPDVDGAYAYQLAFHTFVGIAGAEGVHALTSRFGG